MKQIIPRANILACGVWHKAPNTRSSLDEAIAALGRDCLIVNGGFFNGNGTPSSAYSIAGKDYHTGGCQYGLSLAPPNDVRFTYLRQYAPDFIGAYPMYWSGGQEGGKSDGLVTARMILGLKADGGAYVETSTGLTITAALQKAAAAGCSYAINLDGGGSVQYHLPDGTNYYGTDPRRKVLNWVYFRIKKEEPPVGVKTYYKTSEGNNKLSPHFKVKEFACKDGTDQILIDAILPAVLEDIRAACGGKPVVITSGYRTAAHNASVGGSPNSQHLPGRAADIMISGADTLAICKAAEKALDKQGIAGGIGRYVGEGFVHVDTRASRSRWQRDKKGQAEYPVNGWDDAAATMPTIKKGSTGEAVKTAQKALGGLTADGVFGPKTDTAVRAFQKAKGLSVDGIVGAKTWPKLLG